MTRHWLLSIAVAACTVLPASAQGPASSSDGEAIRTVVMRFTNAWNQHDAHEFSLVFAETADFTNVKGMGASGRVPIEQFHAGAFQTYFKASHLTASVKSTRFIKPDVVAVDVLWEMTGATAPSGVPIPLRQGLANLVMTKQGESWSILVMHNMDLPVQPPTPK
jgi:uncharacterized protein (TIGR02246 family)